MPRWLALMNFKLKTTPAERSTIFRSRAEGLLHYASIGLSAEIRCEMKVQMKLFLCRLAVIRLDEYYVSNSGCKKYGIQVSTEAAVLDKNRQRPPSGDEDWGG